MSETYKGLQRATVGEAATGTHGSEFLRNNVTTIADKIEHLSATGTLDDEAVIAPTLLNSWVNFGGADTSAGYYKSRSGIVRLCGTIKNGTTTPGTVLMTLPAGYRPAAIVRFAVTSNDLFGSVEVQADGDVAIRAGSATSLSLDSISYRV